MIRPFSRKHAAAAAEVFLVGATLLCVGSLRAAESKAPVRIDFNRDIRPILSDTCYKCHGPDAKQVKGGLRLDLRDVATKPMKSGEVAIVPKNTAKSELVRRITAKNPDD